MRLRVAMGQISLTAMLLAAPARAEFLVSSAIIEFTADGPHQQDIELVSRSKDNDYIVTEVSEVLHPGEANESRRVITDPADGALLVTPDKSILAGGTRRVLRFVVLKPADAHEHIYRVAIKPVINNIASTSKVGLKVLIGYEVLVIIRPAVMAPAYQARRQGNMLLVHNTGNTNVLLQNGSQCEPDAHCPLPPVKRIYPGGTEHIALPSDAPVTYSVWDGAQMSEKTF